ncbi:MAG: ABC transporter permease, partial [Lachnospiraceae bacterium]|nr:ABC transporter permease [Lachnospiraceae bacterium]
TTKNGWKKIALAKIITGLAFTVELFTLIAISQIVSQLFFMGTTGWDMPIQMIKLIAIAPMNMLQGEIYEYVYTLLGAIGYAGVVMLLSAAVKNNAQALLLSLGVVYALPLLGKFLPYGVQIAIDCIPLAGSATDIFRTNTLQVFGKVIWTPWLLVSVPVLIGILCMPGALKGWARRLKI